MADRNRLGQAFEALSDPHRRQVLLALLESSPQHERDIDPVTIAADGGKDSTISHLELRLHHLPKLADWGFVTWDQKEGTIRRGPAWDEIAPVLKVVSENRERLPGPAT